MTPEMGNWGYDEAMAEIGRLREALAQKPFPMQLDDALKEIDALRKEAAFSMTVQRERADSFARFAKAVGGIGVTEWQPEADIEIEARIRSIVRERDTLRSLLTDIAREFDAWDDWRAKEGQ